MAHIMTSKKLSRYLKLHEITICKYAAVRQIPAIRIGSVWRFDKDVIDDWIRTGQTETKAAGRSKRKGAKEKIWEEKTKEMKSTEFWKSEIDRFLMFDLLIVTK